LYDFIVPDLIRILRDHVTLGAKSTTFSYPVVFWRCRYNAENRLTRFRSIALQTGITYLNKFFSFIPT